MPSADSIWRHERFTLQFSKFGNNEPRIVTHDGIKLWLLLKMDLPHTEQQV